MEKQKKVSILIPAYNHEEFVADCIESVLAQDYKNIEVLICDDKSSDKTYEIIRTYEKKLKERFQTVIIEQNKRNLGISANCNLIWKRATGDYYKFIASDDMLVKDAISRFVSFFEEHKDVDIVYSNIYEIDKDVKYSDIKKGCLYGKMFNKQQPMGKNLTSLLLGRCFIPAVSVMISKRTRNKYGIFNENLSFEDWEYWLRVSVDGNIQYMHTPTAFYRKLRTSASNFSQSQDGCKKYEEYTKDGMKILMLYKDFLTRESLKKFFESRIFLAYYLHDIKYIRKLNRSMKKNNLSISYKTKVKILLVELGLYDFIKNTYIVFCKLK